jgi:hypothetical protein
MCCWCVCARMGQTALAYCRLSVGGLDHCWRFDDPRDGHCDRRVPARAPAAAADSDLSHGRARHCRRSCAPLHHTSPPDPQTRAAVRGHAHSPSTASLSPMHGCAPSLSFGRSVTIESGHTTYAHPHSRAHCSAAGAVRWMDRIPACNASACGAQPTQVGREDQYRRITETSIANYEKRRAVQQRCVGHQAPQAKAAPHDGT